MAEQIADAVIEDRLRDFLTAELRQAEHDYPHLAPRKAGRGRRAGWRDLAALAVCGALAILVVGIWARPFASTPSGQAPVVPGGDPLGPDGIPLSIGGEPVLRVGGNALDARMAATGDPGSLLAGGYLVLHSRDCTLGSPAPSRACSEDWRLDDTPGADAGRSVRLSASPGGVTFTRTSGAPTVFRARVTTKAVGGGAGGYGGTTGPGSPLALLIESVAWRQPTKGRIPEDAFPPQGGDIQMALVPDFVGVWGGPAGETIVGYTPKDLLLNPPALVGGTPQNPPQDPPIPVYGEDLKTLVGYSVAGKGFVPLGVDPSTVSGFPVEQGPSMGPSAAPSPSGTRP